MSTGVPASPPRAELLANAALRERLTRMVRSRVPVSDVEDVVQATLTEALAAADAPEDPEQFIRWVHGVARHKCADHFRRRGREHLGDEPIDGEVPGDAEPVSARDFLRWAERELPEGEPAERTFEWMLREADGDKLEHIAEEERLPAPRVRQRVTRLRRHFRERWAAQAAALVALVTLAAIGFAVYRLWRDPGAPEAPIAKEPVPVLERATELRREALERCGAGEWQRCLRDLDEAARLDPAGDRAGAVTEARDRAREALATERATPPAPSAQRDAPPAPSDQRLDLRVPAKKPLPPPSNERSAPVEPKQKSVPMRATSEVPSEPSPAPAPRGTEDDGFSSLPKAPRGLGNSNAQKGEDPSPQGIPQIPTGK